MANRRYRQSQRAPEPAPSPELSEILCDLESPDERTRADAVRQLCPCRGTAWEIPVFERVAALRHDPSALVRHAVRHDLDENPDWGQRSESRRLEGRRRQAEIRRVKREIDAQASHAGEVMAADDAVPAPHSLGWRMRPRPRTRRPV